MGLGHQPLILHGDSALFIAFMQKRYKPGKPQLAALVSATRQLLASCRGWPVHCVHVPRDCNRWADWLGQ